MRTVHILSLPDEAMIAPLKAQLSPAIRLSTGPLEKEKHGSYDFEILVSGFPSRDDLCASPALKALVIPWAGLSWRVAQTLKEFPHLSVHNIHHNAQPVAEAALSLLLAVAKRVVPFDSAFRQGIWLSRTSARNDALCLEGKKVLVLGYGAIGQRVARLCEAFGMEVSATRRRLDKPTKEGSIQLLPEQDMKEALSQTEVLFVCLPLTSETKGLLGREELFSLPSRAVLINVARAKIVEEEALFEALKTKHLFGAGLDVWYRYPRTKEEEFCTFPSRLPFHELDNVVMSPHRADHCEKNEVLRVKALVELLNALAEGEKDCNRMSVEAGY